MVQTPERSVIENSKEIGKLRNQPKFKEQEMRAHGAALPYAPYSGQAGVSVTRPTTTGAVGAEASCRKQATVSAVTPAAAAAAPSAPKYFRVCYGRNCTELAQMVRKPG